MGVLGAIMKGLTGGYLALAVGVTLMVRDKMDEPGALDPLLARVQSLPGVEDLQMALARTTAPRPSVPAKTRRDAGSGTADLTELQKLRLRTHGDLAADRASSE